MDGETERQDAPSEGPKRKSGPRVDTRRLAGKVQYVRESQWGGPSSTSTGRLITFRFTLPPGTDRLPDEIYRLFKDHQHLPDGHPTGLISKKNGTEWRMPEHEHTRSLADRLDMQLKNLADRLDQEQSPGR